MLNVGEVEGCNCEGITRRELLQVGALGALGLTLADAFRTKAEASEPIRNKREMSCIFLWLDGGPSHFETFDPKPDTPIDIRGPYGAIETNTPGVRISELLPMLAQHADKYALIRSLAHGVDAHSAIPMMTGNIRSTTAHGAVVTYLKGFTSQMPPYVHLGANLGIGGGSLGPAFNPVVVADPTGKNIELPDFSLKGLTPSQFARRKFLLGAVDDFRRKMEHNAPLQGMDSSYQRAMEMLTSAKVRDAFDLSKESARARDRYGANFFGQSCLMARRLVEAGTRFVQVKWYDGIAFHGWDVHGADLAGLSRMEQQLCPRFDQGVSALLEDLHQRGLLETTLVVATGEFGRTPKINKLGGRDHWPHCFSALMAGAGVPAGTVVGASDPQGAYPATRPIKAHDFAATLYRLLGFNPNTDDRVREFAQGGEVIAELV
jgi:hypothetical protein